MFKDVSKILRREIERFEVGKEERSIATLVSFVSLVWCLAIPCAVCFQSERIKEFKEKFTSYLESLMHMQQEVGSAECSTLAD